MTRAELARWLAGHRPAPIRVCAVDEHGREHPISLTRGAHRWVRAANILAELRAVSVRLYDSAGALAGSTDIEHDVPETQTPVAIAPAPQTTSEMAIARNASDVATIASAIADAIRSAVRDATHAQAQAVASAVQDVARTQAEAHRAAFSELREVARVAVERLVAVEQLAHESLERQRAEIDAREAELEQGKQLDGLVRPLIEGAAPELVRRIMGPSDVKPQS